MTPRVGRVPRARGAAGLLLPGPCRGGVRPSGDGREDGEPLPAGGECCGPGPGCVDPQPAAAGAVGEASGQAVEAETHGVRLGVGQAVDVQRTGQTRASARPQPWAARMDVPAPEVEIRDLGLRWGSYTPTHGAPVGAVALHWALFQLPPHIVEYVIAHAPAHIRVPGHGTDYRRLLRGLLSECEERRGELDELGHRAWLGGMTDTAGTGRIGRGHSRPRPQGGTGPGNG
jgi:hypothetical protein